MSRVTELEKVDTGERVPQKRVQRASLQSLNKACDQVHPWFLNLLFNTFARR